MGRALRRARPASGTARARSPQIGGIGLLALAFLLWSAGSTPELRRPVAIAGVLFYLGSAVLIASWLIFRDKADLGIGDGGVVVADHRRSGCLRGARAALARPAAQ